MKPDAKDVPRELVYCPHCKALHVDLHEWARRPHHEHLCETCGKLFDLGRYVFGINLDTIPPDLRTPHQCHLCHARYRVRGSIDEGEVPVRNVCVCEVTATCGTCGHGFVVQRDLHDDREDPVYRCRACASGLVDVVVPPVARTGPRDLHDVGEHLDYYLRREKRRFRCEACVKGHVGSRSHVEKSVTQGYLFGCPTCGATELVLAAPAEAAPAPDKKIPVQWRRRTRGAPKAGEDGDEG